METLKKIGIFIWKHIQSIFLIIGSIFLSILALQKYNEKKQLQNLNYKKIPGINNEIEVLNNEGKWEKVKLPIIKRKQITYEDIKAIRSIKTNGEFKFTIKHEIKDRRDIIDNDHSIDNTGMDI